MRRFVGVLLAAVFLAAPATADAARLVRVAGGFDMSIYATKRFGSLYVVEQDGQIWRKSSGTRSLFLDIRGDVRCCGEEGLLLCVRRLVPDESLHLRQLREQPQQPRLRSLPGQLEVDELRASSKRVTRLPSR